MLSQNRFDLLCLALVLVSVCMYPTGTSLGAAITPTPTPNSVTMGHEDFTVKFDDFTTKAQLTYPTNNKGPFATVILLHSFGLGDMDNHVLGDPNDSPTFLQIAQYLAQRGIAVVRFNEHYINSINDKYPTQLATLTVMRLSADADAVYQQVVKNRKVDPKRILFWGWGESSPIAAYLASQHKEIAGLILQSPVIGTLKDNFYAMYNLFGLPYIRQYVDADHDGKISAAEAASVFSQQNTHDNARQWVSYLMDFVISNGKISSSLKSTIDTNHDSFLDIEQEIEPYFRKEFEHFYDETDQFNPFGFLVYRSSAQFPLLIDSVKTVQQPILIVQGGNDALVPAQNAKYVDNILTSIDNADHTMLLFPGLGHSLSLVYSIFEDKFGSVEPEALDGIDMWINSHFGNS